MTDWTQWEDDFERQEEQQLAALMQAFDQVVREHDDATPYDVVLCSARRCRRNGR
jgi:hypothetical protein